MGPELCPLQHLPVELRVRPRDTREIGIEITLDRPERSPYLVRHHPHELRFNLFYLLEAGDIAECADDTQILAFFITHPRYNDHQGLWRLSRQDNLLGDYRILGKIERERLVDNFHKIFLPQRLPVIHADTGINLTCYVEHFQDSRVPQGKLAFAIYNKDAVGHRVHYRVQLRFLACHLEEPLIPLFAKLFLFYGQPPLVEAPVYDGQELIGVERFRYVIVGTVLHCLYCCFNGCETRYHDEYNTRIYLSYLFHHLESTHDRHHEIDEDKVVGISLRLLQPKLAIFGCIDGVAFR